MITFNHTLNSGFKLTVVALTLIAWISASGYVHAQSSIRSDLTSSKMSIAGTSTLHDWVSTVDAFEARAIVDGNVLKDVSCVAQVESIKSGKSGMDRNTYNALMSKKYPEITFTARELSINGADVTGSGTLTIAGKSNTIPVSLSIETWAEGTYNIIGTVDLKMTDYGIDPPRAMMGTIRTGDDISINLDLSLNAY